VFQHELLSTPLQTITGLPPGLQHLPAGQSSAWRMPRPMPWKTFLGGEAGPGSDAGARMAGAAGTECLHSGPISLAKRRVALQARLDARILQCRCAMA